MDTNHRLEVQKQSLADLFAQAKAYTSVIMVSGYAGLFALWNIQSDKLTHATSLGVGLLLAVSVTAFVGWEIYGMVQRYISLSALRKSIDSPAEIVTEFTQVPRRMQRLMRQLERMWAPVILLAGGSATLAMLMLVSAFGHGLLIEFGQDTFSKESAVEFNFLSLVFGGLLAGLIGFTCFRLEAWRRGKQGKKPLAQALESDLRSSVELYTQLASVWGDEKTVLFDLLDQLDFVRSNFATDRTHLALLDDESMRNRLNNYYRTSYVTLSHLRRDQEHIYLTDDPKKKAHLEQKIADLFEELSDHRAEAAELADQMVIRFL